MNDALTVRYSAQPARDSSEHLVLLLHGYGSHELDLLGLAPMLPEGLVFAGLRAPLPMGPGFAWFPLSSDVGFTPESVTRAAELVEKALIEEIRPVDFASVTLLGFSQGMALATVLAQRNPAQFSALVGLSGFWVETDVRDEAARKAVEELPAFYGRGLADQVIPAAMVSQTLQLLRTRESTVIRDYPGMPHSICPEEMEDVSAFLTRVLRLGS